MKHLKRFNESVESDLYNEEPFISVKLPKKNIKRNIISIIKKFLSENDNWKVGEVIVNNVLGIVISKTGHVEADESFRVFGLEDDYYLVCHFQPDPSNFGPIVYKCDQIEGVIKFLEDKL